MSDAKKQDDIAEIKSSIKTFDKKFNVFESHVDGKFGDFENRVDAKIEKAVTDISLLISDFSNQVANEFVKTNNRVEKVQKDINFIINQIDAISKKQEIDDDERLVMGAHLDRMDKWLHELADKIGYKIKV